MRGLVLSMTVLLLLGVALAGSSAAPAGSPAAPSAGVAGATGAAPGQCEPAPAVRQLLDQARPVEEVRLPVPEMQADWRTALDAALAAHPGDYFLLHARMQREETRSARLRWAKALAEAHPDWPVVELLSAQAMVGTDTPEARRRLEAVLQAHPEMARAHLTLAHIAETPRFKDTAVARREVAAFLAACPAPLEESALNLVLRTGAPEDAAAVAAALRRRLASDGSPAPRAEWETLWKLEFKTRPPAEHAAVRQRIAADVERLAALPQRHELPVLLLLREGYTETGNASAVNVVEDEVLQAWPRSSAAHGVLEARNRKTMAAISAKLRERREARAKAATAGGVAPGAAEGVGGGSDAGAPATAATGAPDEVAELIRASAKETDEMRQRWPDDSMDLGVQFYALLRSPIKEKEVPPAELTAAADAALAAYERDPRWWGMTPMEFDVVEGWCRVKAHLERVDGVVEAAYRREAERLRDKDDDTAGETRHAIAQRGLDLLALERARVLLSCYDAARRPGDLAVLDAALASMTLGDPQMKPILLARRAQAAEIAKRPADAFALYRAAAAEGKSPLSLPGDDKKAWAENAARLWKDLGGTDAGIAALGAAPPAPPAPAVPPAGKAASQGVAARASAASATATAGKAVQAAASDAAAEAPVGHWEAVDMQLPDFTLSDLAGKGWRRADLAGKVAVINVWATWCVPCQFEHPEFQKLYERLKGRPDVVVLSLAIDDDAGKVEPYMAEHHYSFPALPARDLVDGVVLEMTVPQTWLVDATGRLRWRQLGYNSRADYQKETLAKLDQLLEAQPR